jgi:signal transduction histidine kinase
VIDTGPGLSTEDSSKLFQKFYRAQSSAGKQMGTGLGLYVSKLLVEKFGGTIGFQSELGKGSTFWFELPLVLQ